jgi:hypothetical protein
MSRYRDLYELAEGNSGDPEAWRGDVGDVPVGRIHAYTQRDVLGMQRYVAIVRLEPTGVLRRVPLVGQLLQHFKAERPEVGELVAIKRLDATGFRPVVDRDEGLAPDWDAA